MGRWLVAAALFGVISCGSGADEISISCNNAGSGNQVCAAAGGPTIDLENDNITAEPTPRR